MTTGWPLQRKAVQARGTQQTQASTLEEMSWIEIRME